jgi:hypothetical protein
MDACEDAVIVTCLIGEPERFESVTALREHVRGHRGGHLLPPGWGRAALQAEHGRYPHGQPARWTNAVGQPLDPGRLPTPTELAAWLAHWARPGHPGVATGRCYATSDALFADLAGAIPDCEPSDGGEWVGYGCVQAGEHPDPNREIREHHVVVAATSLEPYVLDLTARQFDATLPFPLIEPAAAYMTRGQWWTNALNLPPDPRSPADDAR